MEWSTGCPDWEERILGRRSLIPFAPLYPSEAADGLRVMRELRIVDAPGSPTIGESCAQWVLDFAGAVFGSYDPETGSRLIREFFLMVPKKASKSTIAAAIMMTLLLRNWRQSAELIVLAPTVEVAQNAFAPARDMVKVDAELSDLLHVQEHVRTITHRTSGATLKIVAADSNTVAGKKAAFVLVDEVHQFGAMANAEGMLREATGGLAARPEGCVIYLTTQSDQPPAGIFRQKLAYARGVRDGRIEDRQFLPVIYELPPAVQDEVRRDRRMDPAYFQVVNPNIGYSVDPGYLDREHRKAETEGVASLTGFLAKFANVEVGLALQSDRWAGAECWEQQGTRLSLDDVLQRSEVVTVGIDGGGKDDMLALVVLGRERGTGNWLAWAHAWLHEKALALRKQEATRYQGFAEDGDLTIVTGSPHDVLQLAGIVSKVARSGLLPAEKGIGLDPEKTHKVVLEALLNEDIDECQPVAIPQSWRLIGAITVTERKLDECALWHSGSRLMAWCVGNAKVEPRGNAAVITKQASGSAKIDPLMALFDAVSIMSLNPAAARSWWEDAAA